jgi:hypothetical protein
MNATLELRASSSPPGQMSTLNANLGWLVLRTGGYTTCQGQPLLVYGEVLARRSDIATQCLDQLQRTP